MRFPPPTHPVMPLRERTQARLVRDAVARRLVEVGLELHPDKTRIVYCKDSNRRGDYEVCRSRSAATRSGPGRRTTRHEGRASRASSGGRSGEADRDEPQGRILADSSAHEL